MRKNLKDQVIAMIRDRAGSKTLNQRRVLCECPGYSGVIAMEDRLIIDVWENTHRCVRFKINPPDRFLVRTYP